MPNNLAPRNKNSLAFYERELPMQGRATFLPYQDTLPGSVMNQRSFALPHPVASAVNTLSAAGRALSGSDPSFDPVAEAANFAMTTMGGGIGASRLAPAPRNALGMNVYQGSPHRFPPTAKNPLGEFDASKIGTGEGAQAYGHGHYSAEARNVAQTYNPNPGIAADSYKKSIKYWEKDLLSDNPARVAKAQNEIFILNKKLANQEGSLYTIDLPDEHIAKMLDYDKPLSQQMHLMDRTGPHGPDFTFKNLLERFGIDPANTTGGQFLQEIGAGRGQEKSAAISKTLSEYGIPGIRYFDGSSRAAGEGTSNFVVFPGNEDMMRIINRE
jgi:hypothetical protein